MMSRRTITALVGAFAKWSAIITRPNSTPRRYRLRSAA